MMKKIGERLKEYRKIKGYKVVKFSNILNISQGSLSGLENNKSKPSADTLANLVLHTDINIKWLLTGNGEVFDNTISGGLKQDINQDIVSDSLGDGVRMLTKIHAAKNRTHYDNTIKYLKCTADIVEMEERKDSEKSS